MFWKNLPFVFCSRVTPGLSPAPHSLPREDEWDVDDFLRDWEKEESKKWRIEDIDDESYSPHSEMYNHDLMHLLHSWGILLGFSVLCIGVCLVVLYFQLNRQS